MAFWMVFLACRLHVPDLNHRPLRSQILVSFIELESEKRRPTNSGTAGSGGLVPSLRVWPLGDVSKLVAVCLDVKGGQDHGSCRQSEKCILAGVWLVLGSFSINCL